MVVLGCGLVHGVHQMIGKGNSWAWGMMETWER